MEDAFFWRLKIFGLWCQSWEILCLMSLWEWTATGRTVTAKHESFMVALICICIIVAWSIKLVQRTVHLYELSPGQMVLEVHLHGVVFIVGRHTFMLWTLTMNRQVNTCVALVNIWCIHWLIKYSLGFLHPVTTAEAFEAIDWLADLTPTNMAASSRPVEWCHFDVILLKSTAAILAAAMFVGNHTTAWTLLAGAAAVDASVYYRTMTW